jgi:hypothetical protein
LVFLVFWLGATDYESFETKELLDGIGPLQEEEEGGRREPSTKTIIL